jgi:hypothetical protein
MTTNCPGSNLAHVKTIWTPEHRYRQSHSKRMRQNYLRLRTAWQILLLFTRTATTRWWCLWRRLPAQISRAHSSSQRNTFCRQPTLQARFTIWWEDTWLVLHLSIFRWVWALRVLKAKQFVSRNCFRFLKTNYPSIPGTLWLPIAILIWGATW